MIIVHLYYTALEAGVAHSTPSLFCFYFLFPDICLSLFVENQAREFQNC